jgi:myosin-1
MQTSVKGFACSFVKGFITRNGEVTDMNRAFLDLAKAEYLIRLSKNLPTKLKDRSWPPHPVVCKEVT